MLEVVSPIDPSAISMRRTRVDALAFLALLVFCAVALCTAETRLVTISNIKPRLSNSGDIVNAHDGTIQWLQGKWYYHGAQYREDPDPP